MTRISSPRALLVDLFGTLVPKWPGAASMAAKQEMARRAGIDEHTFRTAWHARYWDRELGCITTEQCIEEILRTHRGDASPRLVAELFEVWRETVRGHLSPRPEVPRALERVRSAGVRIALVSNAGPTVPALFRNTELARAVDHAVFSCAVGAAKPDARIYRAACDALQVAPVACVYVGDGGDEELDGARTLGMAPVLLRIQSEIEQEGLPPGAANWDGPVIETFEEIHRHVGIC